MQTSTLPYLRVTRVKPIVLLIALLVIPFFGVAFADHSPSKTPLKYAPPRSHWSAVLGVGSGDYVKGTKKDTFQITSIETDSLVQLHRSHNAFWMLGFQHFTPISHGVVSGVSIGPIVYYQPVRFSGEVNQFQVSALNNYTYRYKAHPINTYLEMDAWLGHLKIQNHAIVPYIFVGGGASFVKLRYREQVTPAALAIGVPASSTRQGSGWDEVLSYEVGGGIAVTLNPRWSLEGRYVYQHPNRAEVPLANAIGPVKVNLTSSSGYILLRYRFS